MPQQNDVFGGGKAEKSKPIGERAQAYYKKHTDFVSRLPNSSYHYSAIKLAIVCWWLQH